MATKKRAPWGLPAMPPKVNHSYSLSLPINHSLCKPVIPNNWAGSG